MGVSPVVLGRDNRRKTASGKPAATRAPARSDHARFPQGGDLRAANVFCPGSRSHRHADIGRRPVLEATGT